MPRPTAFVRLRSPWIAAAICAVTGGALFQFAGNATRGYLPTSSAFWWWISQWIDPGAETQHGWIILALSAWLLWRNLHGGNAESRTRNAELAGGPDAGAHGQVEAQTCDEVGAADQDAREARPSDSAGGSNQRVGDNALHLKPGGTQPGKCGVFEHSAFGIWHSAFPALLAALALHAVGFVAQQTRISLIGLLVFAWGVLRLGGGPRWGRAAAFPLGFLVFAIPVNVLDSLGFWLRLWVVEAAETFARVFRFGLVRSGTQLFAASGHYQYDVAAACSGVRSLMALAALSLLIGYLSFRSPWRRGLMLAVCFPLTYLGNVVRIGAIILAAQAGGQRWGERAHDIMGFGVFAIVLGGVLLVARLLERIWPEAAAPSSVGEIHPIGDSESRAAIPLGLSVGDGVCNIMYYKPHADLTGDVSGSSGTRRDGMRFGAPFVAAAIVVGLAGAEAGWLSRLGGTTERGAAGVRLTADGRDPVPLPAFIGTEWVGRRAEVTTIERDILPADTGFSRRQYVALADGAHGVFVSVVLSGRDRTSIHRPEVCLVGQGWTLSPPTPGQFAVAGREPLPVTCLRAQLHEPRTGRIVRGVVAYTFVSSDAVVASHVQRFMHDAWNRLRHGRADRWAYVLAIADADDGDAAALARMQAVFAGVAPALLATK